MISAAKSYSDAPHCIRFGIDRQVFSSAQQDDGPSNHLHKVGWKKDPSVEGKDVEQQEFSPLETNKTTWEWTLKEALEHSSRSLREKHNSLEKHNSQQLLPGEMEKKLCLLI